MSVDPGEDILAQDVISGNYIYAADAGSNDTYVISLPLAPSSYTDGLTIRFKANTANTGACTLNINSLGAIAIKRADLSDTQSGDIVDDQIVEVVYLGGSFVMVSPFATSKKMEVDTAEVTVSNTTTETTLFDYSIPANALSTNNVIRFEAFIDLQLKQGGGAIGTFRLKLGSTTVATMVLTVSGAANVDVHLHGIMKGYIVSDGATGAQKCALVFFGGDGEVSSDNQTGTGGSYGGDGIYGASTEDSTSAKTMTLTVQFNNADTSNNVTAEFWIVEVIR